MFSVICLAVGAGCWLGRSLLWFLILKRRKRVRAETARLWRPRFGSHAMSCGILWVKASHKVAKF